MFPTKTLSLLYFLYIIAYVVRVYGCLQDVERLPCSTRCPHCHPLLPDLRVPLSQRQVCAARPVLQHRGRLWRHVGRAPLLYRYTTSGGSSSTFSISGLRFCVWKLLCKISLESFQAFGGIDHTHKHTFFRYPWVRGYRCSSNNLY